MSKRWRVVAPSSVLQIPGGKSAVTAVRISSYISATYLGFLDLIEDSGRNLLGLRTSKHGVPPKLLQSTCTVLHGWRELLVSPKVGYWSFFASAILDFFLRL